MMTASEATTRGSAVTSPSSAVPDSSANDDGR